MPPGLSNVGSRGTIKTSLLIWTLARHLRTQDCGGNCGRFQTRPHWMLFLSVQQVFYPVLSPPKKHLHHLEHNCRANTNNGNNNTVESLVFWHLYLDSSPQGMRLLAQGINKWNLHDDNVVNAPLPSGLNFSLPFCSYAERQSNGAQACNYFQHSQTTEMIREKKWLGSISLSSCSGN